MFRSHRSTCMPVSNWQLKLHMMITGLSLGQSCGLGFCSDKCTGWLIWLCGVTLWRFSLRVTGLRAGDLLFSICWLRFCVCLLCQLWFRLCFTCIFGYQLLCIRWLYGWGSLLSSHWCGYCTCTGHRNDFANLWRLKANDSTLDQYM